MRRSVDVDWAALSSAMTDVVAATGLDEVAEAVVRGCHRGLACQSMAVWLSDLGVRPRLIAAEGTMSATPETISRLGSPELRLDFAEDDRGRPAWLATMPMEAEAGLAVLVQGVFSKESYVDAGQRRAIELLCSVAHGALSRSRSSENARRVGLLLQRHLLPTLEQVRTGHAAVRYVPAGEGADVGGDWYDIIHSRDGRTVLVVGDVAGHSVEAAVEMSVVRAALHSHLLEGLPASLALARVNDLMIDRHGFATCCCVEISAHGTVVTSAGHPPPITATHRGHATICDAHPGPPLGAVNDAAYPGRRCDLEPGDVIILYSDGLVEEPAGDIGAGIERVRRATANATHDDLDHVAAHLLGLAGDLAELRDDITILAFQPSPEFFRTVDMAAPSAAVPTAQMPLDAEVVWRLVDAAPDAMVVIDADGTVMLANQRTENLLGYSRSELIAGPVDVVFPEGHAERHAQLRRRYLQDPSSPSLGRGVFPVQCQNGAVVVVDVTLSAVRLHERTYVVANLREADRRTISADDVDYEPLEMQPRTVNLDPTPDDPA